MYKLYLKWDSYSHYGFLEVVVGFHSMHPFDFFQNRFILYVPWDACCIRPVWCWVLLSLWGLVTHTSGSEDYRWHVSWRSLLSPGLLCADALSHRTLQQQNQEQSSLWLPALSSRSALVLQMLHTIVYYCVSFICQKIHDLIHQGIISDVISVTAGDCSTIFLLFCRVPVCHQRALFPFPYLSSWLLLSKHSKRQLKGFYTLLTWKHVPPWIW